MVVQRTAVTIKMLWSVHHFIKKMGNGGMDERDLEY